MQDGKTKRFLLWVLYVDDVIPSTAIAAAAVGIAFGLQRLLSLV